MFGKMSGAHILWILNGCGLESGSITGGPLRAHEISRRWQRGGLEQTLLTTPGGAAMLLRMGCQLPVWHVRASLLAKRETFRAMRLWSYCVSAWAARRKIRHMPPVDVAITVSDYFCDIAPALALKRLQPDSRWIAWIHHKELPPGKRPGNRLVNALTWRMQEWSFRKIARYADQAWVLNTDAGDQVRQRLLELGMPAERIRGMSNGIDTAAIRRVSEPAKTSDAVMIGVRPNKGMHDIIPAWREVQRLRPGTTLRLMGGMSGVEPVIAEIKRCGLDRVIEVFRPDGGYLAAAKYYGKIKESRVLFAPSHEEGWGIAVCEALCCGLPVAAYDLPAYRRVYGEALALAPCFDALALAAQVVRLLDDDAARSRHVSAGLETASRYDWDAIAREDAAVLPC